MIWEDEIRKTLVKAMCETEIIAKSGCKLGRLCVFIIREGMDDIYNVIICDYDGNNILMSQPEDTLNEKLISIYNYYAEEPYHERGE